VKTARVIELNGRAIESDVRRFRNGLDGASIARHLAMMECAFDGDAVTVEITDRTGYVERYRVTFRVTAFATARKVEVPA
jgi:hypothetical protein